VRERDRERERVRKRERKHVIEERRRRIAHFYHLRTQGAEVERLEASGQPEPCGENETGQIN
jgi:hypothetical protein